MAGQRDKVLIVDDDQTIADTTALIFSKQGYEAKAAYSAEQALTIVREWPPSLAILDVCLPKLDGIALARLMRLVCPACRVILISSQDIADELFAGIPDDVPVLAKPIPPPQLLAFVDAMLLAR